MKGEGLGNVLKGLGMCCEGLMICYRCWRLCRQGWGKFLRFLKDVLTEGEETAFLEQRGV